MGNRKQERTQIAPLEIVIEAIDSSNAHFENVSIFVDEVSQDGMRVSTSVEFNVEEIIHFRLPSIGITHLILGRIAWKERVEGGLSLYGIQILECPGINCEEIDG